MHGTVAKAPMRIPKAIAACQHDDKTHRASTGDLICPTLLLSDDSSEVVSSAAIASLLRAERPEVGSSAIAKLLPNDEGPGGDVEGDAGPPSSMSDSLVPGPYMSLA